MIEAKNPFLDEGFDIAAETESVESSNRDLDIVRQYFAEVESIPIPDPTEIRQLGDLIKQGKNAKDILATLEFAEIPIEDEVLQIKALAEAGEIAKERLVIGHLRFAAHVARQSMGWQQQPLYGNGYPSQVFVGVYGRLERFASAPLPLSDRIQIANQALMKAAEKYDGSKGAFTTYSMYWIERELDTAIQQDRNLRIPLNVLADVRKVTAHPETLSRTQFSGAASTVRFIQETSKPISLDALQEESARLDDDESPLTFLDTFKNRDSYEDEPYELASQNERAEALHKALDYLPERSIYIVENRSLCDPEDILSLEQIGRVVGVTRERVRQIENDAHARIGTNLELLSKIYGDAPDRWSLARRAQRINGRKADLDRKIYNLKLDELKRRLGTTAVKHDDYEQSNIVVSSRYRILSAIREMYDIAPDQMYWLDTTYTPKMLGLEDSIEAIVDEKFPDDKDKRVHALVEFAALIKTELEEFMLNNKVVPSNLDDYRFRFATWLKRQSKLVFSKLETPPPDSNDLPQEKNEPVVMSEVQPVATMPKDLPSLSALQAALMRSAQERHGLI